MKQARLMALILILFPAVSQCQDTTLSDMSFEAGVRNLSVADSYCFLKFNYDKANDVCQLVEITISPENILNFADLYLSYTGPVRVALKRLGNDRYRIDFHNLRNSVPKKYYTFTYAVDKYGEGAADHLEGKFTADYGVKVADTSGKGDVFAQMDGVRSFRSFMAIVREAIRRTPERH